MPLPDEMKEKVLEHYEHQIVNIAKRGATGEGGEPIGIYTSFMHCGIPFREIEETMSDPVFVEKVERLTNYLKKLAGEITFGQTIGKGDPKHLIPLMERMDSAGWAKPKEAPANPMTIFIEGKGPSERDETIIENEDIIRRCVKAGKDRDEFIRMIEGDGDV